MIRDDATLAPAVGPASARSFGITFAVVFGAIALLPLVSGGARERFTRGPVCRLSQTSVGDSNRRDANGGTPSGDMSFLKDLFGFLFQKRVRFVLIPFVLLLVLFVVVLAATQGTAWAPFVYAVF